jgi:hypothetical protein
MPPRRGLNLVWIVILQICRAYGAGATWRRPGRACKRGRNLEGGLLPNAAAPKRTGRALRNSQFAIRHGQGFFSGFHFGLDDWATLQQAATPAKSTIMKTYENELDEMIEVVVELVWSCTIFRALFEKKDADRELKEFEARRSHPHFFITMRNSLLCNFCVTTDLLFHEDKKGKATSLCNLIRDIEVSKPGIAKQLSEKIYAKRNLIKKIGILRNQVCAHRSEAKTEQEVFAEADVRLYMMKEITDLAQLIISELAEEAGGNRRENLELLKLDAGTLNFIEGDAGRIMNAFMEPS